jgi:tripartite-type tricarboxylate transporter receptor subunit TctC
MLLRRLVLASLGLMFAATVGAQNYPTKPVRIIVPFPPGGAVDLIARVMGSRMQEALGQTFIIENRAGANGSIGSDAVAKAAPDGYTLLVQASTLTTNALLFPNLPYDVVRDFAPIAQLGFVPLLLTTNASNPAANLAEFLPRLREAPQKYTFASPPQGSGGNIAIEAMRAQAKTPFEVVVYKGTAPAITDLLGGHVAALIDAMPAQIANVRAGKLKPLAVTGAQRSPQLKDVPTFAESGLPGISIVSWYGLWAPGKLPADLQRLLSVEASKAIKSNEANDRLGPTGFVGSGSTPDEFAKFIATDMAMMSKLIKDHGIKASQ